jgi:hypothetical protein
MNIHFWDWKNMLVGHIKPTLGLHVAVEYNRLREVSAV